MIKTYIRKIIYLYIIVILLMLLALKIVFFLPRVQQVSQL